jgi:FKBP-type peptidyl-prolyl cis-trans isomerase (trigger factor)
MKNTVEHLSSTSMKISMKFTAIEISDITDDIVKELLPITYHKGHPLGQVPRSLIVKKNSDFFRKKLTDNVIDKQIDEILKDYNIFEVKTKSITQYEYFDRQHLRCVCILEYIPEFELPDLEAIQVRQQTPSEIDNIDEMVDKKIAHLAQEGATIIEAPPDHTISGTDLVNLQFTACNSKGKVLVKNKQYTFNYDGEI